MQSIPSLSLPLTTIQVESTLNRFKATKQMIQDSKSFDDTVLAVRKNRDELTPFQGKTLKLKVRVARRVF